MHRFLDGYCSTVEGLLDWFEVDLGFTELLFIQIDLCVLCVFVLYSRVSLSQQATHAPCPTRSPEVDTAPSMTLLMLLPTTTALEELVCACV